MVAPTLAGALLQRLIHAGVADHDVCRLAIWLVPPTDSPTDLERRQFAVVALRRLRTLVLADASVAEFGGPSCAPAAVAAQRLLAVVDLEMAKLSPRPSVVPDGGVR